MENAGTLYLILLLGGCFTLIPSLSLYLWMGRIRTEVQELKRQISALTENSNQSQAPAVSQVPVGTVPTNHICSECGKEGKTDDLMCVYCHTPFYN